jgi:hypothetical protein
MNVQDITSLLTNPSTTAVNTLFCDVSIYKALQVCTADEVKTAKDRNDQSWLNDRQAEYDARRDDLLLFITGQQISKETAQQIDEWANQNPYIRPVDNKRIKTLEAQLEKAIAIVKEAYALRNKLHDQDRFGWDSATNSEDIEYKQMLESLSNAEQNRDTLRKRLSLAQSGFANV